MPDEPERLDLEKVIFERRKYVRVDGTFVLSYSDVTTQQLKSDVTQTKNISLGGLLITTDKKFSPGTVLRLKLRLPDGLDYINVKVLVVDSRQKAKNLLYETRAKFISIKEQDKGAVSRIVQYNLKRQR